jgi:hypothetical protein
MEYLELGTKLIAKTDCKMKDGSGNALIVGKEYEVIFQSKNTEEIAVKSETFPHHFFSINTKDDSYWKRYFDALP